MRNLRMTAVSAMELIVSFEDVVASRDNKWASF